MNRRAALKTSLTSLALLSTISGASTLLPEAGRMKGRVAFITGGARGIGLSVARKLAGWGADIVLFDIASQIDSVPYPLATPADLKSAQAEIEALGSRCLAVQGDVRDLDALRQAVDRAVRELGRLDYVIANAGVTFMGAIEQHDERTIRDLLGVNLEGTIKTIQAATPALKAQGSGRIVTLGSISARAGFLKFSIYAATKWGLIGLTKSLAIELGRYNIACNVVCPTITVTGMTDNEYMKLGLNPQNPSIEAIGDFFKNQLHTLPVGFLDPTEIANAVAFLCSDEASFISGAVLDVNAGYSAHFTA